MNTTANFDGYATPFAFGPKRKQFLDIIQRDGRRIIHQNYMSELQPEWKDVLYRGLLGSIFDLTIQGGGSLSNLPLKKALKEIFKYIDHGFPKERAIIWTLNRMGR